MSASPPQTPRKSPVKIVLSILCALGGIMVGAGISEPLALAGLAAGGFSLVVGVFIVAPLAGERGKQRIINALADPTEEDSAMIELASAHIVGNMARMAEDEEMSVVFKPIVKRIGDIMNENWEMSLKNLASQREKGIGVFNPENALDEAGMMQKLKADLMGGFVEPMLGAAGFEGESLKNARNIMMLKMANMGGGNSGSTSPLISGSSSGKGW